MLKVALDAGHGYNTPGKRTPDDVREWYMNARVCDFIAEKLKQYIDVEVYRVDDITGNTDVANTERVKRVNSLGVDIMISIHHNATGSSWVDNVTGTEVWVHPQGTTADNNFANLLAPKLSAHTGLRNRGVKKEAWTVLGCKPTAVLVEGGFMNSRIDHPVITSWGQEAYAAAVVEALVEYYGLKKKEVVVTPTPTPSDDVLYRVLVGSYAVRENAEKQVEKLKADGYSASIVIYNK